MDNVYNTYKTSSDVIDDNQRVRPEHERKRGSESHVTTKQNNRYLSARIITNVHHHQSGKAALQVFIIQAAYSKYPVLEL